MIRREPAISISGEAKTGKGGHSFRSPMPLEYLIISTDTSSAPMASIGAAACQPEGLERAQAGLECR